MSEDFKYDAAASKAATQSINNSLLVNNFDPGAFREPKFFVYIYSVSPKAFEVRRPPMIPLLNFKACPEGQDYVLVAKMPDLFEQNDRDIDSGEIRIRSHNGTKVALDMLCPYAVDMDSALPPNTYTVDLRAQGVFLSATNPPSAEDVSKARKRLEKYYRGLLEKATALEYTNPKELSETLNEDYHLAADYFGEEYSWHRKRVKKASKVPCPNCGDDIKAGVAFHKDSDGEYCILDWKRAFEAGRVSKKQYDDAMASKAATV